MRFFVAHTLPNCEERAASALQYLSCEVYMPRYLRCVRRARRVQSVPRPLFPRYLFVADDGRGVSHIKRAAGVSDVVRAGLEPIRVAQRIVNQVMAREDDDGFVQLGDKAIFQPDEHVQVNEDWFGVPVSAIFRQMKDETRAIVAMSLLGRMTTAQVPVNLLERAT